MSQFHKQIVQMASSEYPEFLYRNVSRVPNELEQDLKLCSPDSFSEVVMIILIDHESRVCIVNKRDSSEPAW